MGRKRKKNHPNQSEEFAEKEVIQDVLAEETLEETSEDGAEESFEDMVEHTLDETFRDPIEEVSEAMEVEADAGITPDPESYTEMPEEAFYEELAALTDPEQTPEEETINGEEQISEEMLSEDLISEELISDEELSETYEDIAKESDEHSEAHGDESLRSFIGEMGSNLGVWVKKNLSFCIFTLIAVVVCIVVIIVAGKMNRGTPILPETISTNAAGSGTTEVSNAIPLPPDPLAEDAIPEVNELINRYFMSMQSGDLDTFLAIRSYTDSVEKAKFEAKYEYIESYDNIHCYTKPGPYEASYMVYVTYDLKLKDWDKPAPALVTLVVCTDQENHLYIYSGGFDENIVDYIRGVTSQEDVYALITKVQTEYQEVMDSDAAFAEYMSVLNQMIKDGVGIRLAAAAEAGIQPEDSVTPTEATVSENQVDETVSGNEADETGDNGNTSFQVKTTATVNVRMSDSENADKIGKAESGMELTCIEQMQNGWSKVLFDGKTGYIKTEYLVAVGAQTDTGERTTVVGKAIVMQSVNIRGSADMDGNVLGKAYPGTSFDVIAKDWNGWTTILYNGKTAYIRTEYIEFKAN